MSSTRHFFALVICFSFLFLSVSGLVLDCSIASIGFYRSSYPTGDEPLVQTDADDLGFSSGYSPFFYRELKTSPDIGYGEIVLPTWGNSAPVSNNIAIDTTAFPPITNNRIFVNLTVGSASDYPFFPNVTMNFNGNVFANANGETLIPLAESWGWIQFELTDFNPSSPNTLTIDAEGAAHTRGDVTCRRLYYFTITQS